MSESGCNINEQKSNGRDKVLACECNHLTNFATG